MSKLTETVLDRPIAVLVCVMALLLFGISSATGMPLQLYPPMTSPELVVTVEYPHAGPEEVDQLVTQKMVDTSGSLPGLKHLDAYSAEAYSELAFEFAYGTDMVETRNKLTEALEEAKEVFPDGAKNPVIVSMDSSANASISLSVNSREGNDINAYVKQQLIPQLKRINEVGGVKTFSSGETYVSVELYPEAMAQYGLDFQAVTDAVSDANTDLSVGTISFGTQKISMNSKVKYTDVEELKDIPITLSGGQTILLSDIANVHYTNKEPVIVSRFNSIDNITIDISKRQNANVITLSKRVNAVLENARMNNPDLDIRVIFDNSKNIVKSIQSIGETLIMGILLSMFVLFLFFGDFKASLIVSSSMPLSLLATFILMNRMGFSLNLITMSALVIGIGMMVDNAIVVVEMCFRKTDEGLSFKDAAAAGTKAVTTSIIASTLTSVVVYLPMTGLQGMSGQMYSPLGYTIVFALLASLFSALTLIPLCYSVYKPTEKKSLKINQFLADVAGRYEHVMNGVFGHKLIVVLVAVSLLASAGFLASRLPTELMEAADEKKLEVFMRFKAGMSLEGMDEITKHVEEYVATQEEVENFCTIVIREMGYSYIDAYFKSDVKEPTKKIADRWIRELAHYDNRCDISVEFLDSEGYNISASDNIIEIVFQGTDLVDLRTASEQVAAVVADIPGVINVDNKTAQGSYKAEVAIDPQLAQNNGFSPAQLAKKLNESVSGKKVADLTVEDKKYDINVELPAELRTDLNDIQNMMFVNDKGVSVPLSEMAEIRFVDAPRSIWKVDGLIQGTIKATVPAADLAAIEDEIYEEIDQLELPDTVFLGESRAVEVMEDEFGGLGKAIFAAVFLVFMVMAIQFESIRYSLLVMFCVPFAIIGSVLLLLVGGCKLNMTSLIGFLMLAGIVVNNGILLIDTTNEYRKEMELQEALILAAKSRLRPILMTTMTTILSMVPMCIPRGGSEDAMKGMALVIIGGLTSSTLLAFFLLPVFYVILNQPLKGFALPFAKRK